jgi:hypothetical protein
MNGIIDAYTHGNAGDHGSAYVEFDSGKAHDREVDEYAD